MDYEIAYQIKTLYQLKEDFSQYIATGTVSMLEKEIKKILIEVIYILLF